MGLFGDRIKGAKDAIFGKQGGYYQAPAFDSMSHKLLDNEIAHMNSAPVQAKLNQYASGKLSLKDLLAGMEGRVAEGSALVTNPLAAGKFASEQVQNDPILSQLFGEGGAMQRANTEEQQLASRGYSLQPEDYEAYGQAQDQIARNFGQQEQGLAQALSNRGLAQGGGGITMANFAGLQGNKAEQLAAQQRGIAQQRMNMNLQRLNQTRSYLSGLGAQAANASQANRQANLAGVGQRQGLMQDQANRDLNIYNAQNAAMRASQHDKAAAYVPGFFDSVHAGANKGAGNFANSFMSGGFMGKGGFGGLMNGGGGQDSDTQAYQGRQQQYWNSGNTGPVR